MPEIEPVDKAAIEWLESSRREPVIDNTKGGETMGASRLAGDVAHSRTLQRWQREAAEHEQEERERAAETNRRQRLKDEDPEAYERELRTIEAGLYGGRQESSFISSGERRDRLSDALEQGAAELDRQAAGQPKTEDANRIRTIPYARRGGTEIA